MKVDGNSWLHQVFILQKKKDQVWPRLFLPRPSPCKFCSKKKSGNDIRYVCGVVLSGGGYDPQKSARASDFLVLRARSRFSQLLLSSQLIALCRVNLLPK